jgi:non-specific protein-tyrosine kinase
MLVEKGRVQESGSTPVVRFNDYLKIMRARKWIIIQAVVVVMFVIVVTSALQKPIYKGEAKVLITSSDAGAAIFGSSNSDLAGATERGSQTQVEIIKSSPVAELAARSLASSTSPYPFSISPDDLLNRVSVEAVGQTNIVTVSATDGSAIRAAAMANALAAAYVQWSKDAQSQSIKAAADKVQNRLNVAESEILSLAAQARTSGDSAALSDRLALANAKYATLSQKLEELRVNEELGVANGRVMGVAAVPTTPISPKPFRSAVLGLGVALVLGVSLALVAEQMDSTVKSVEEAESLYGAPVLGDIPGEKSPDQRLAMVLNPGGVAAEAYRVLRSNLNFVNFNRDIHTLLITSSEAGEGKSTVAANLAAVLAIAGEKVALVNADFHKPIDRDLFRVNNTIGLSDILVGSASVDAVIQRPKGVNLIVVSPGKTPPNPSELLGSDRMEPFIEELKKWADWIIVDSPPLLATSDAVALTRWSDAVLLVAHAGVSTRQSAAAGREMLERVGARTVGVVVWGLKKGRASGGYGFHGAYGSSGLSESGTET